MEDYDTGYSDGVRDTDTRKNVIISWIIIAIAVLAMFGFISFPAAAAGAPCAPKDLMAATLKSKYKEQRFAAGLMGHTRIDGVMELFVSGDGTWTMTRTNVNGVSCIVAVGQNFHRAEPVVQPDPDA